jgi:flagellar protein FliS
MNPGLSYRESSVAGADPLRLVILLYEQAIEDLRRAAEANARGDVERRTGEINHALLVIGHLQATLDRDHGGIVADNLNLFYDQLRSGLIAAQCAQSTERIERQISYLILVRDAWCGLEKNLAPNASLADPHTLTSEWKA